MKLYIMRHGETEWNTKGFIQGSADIPLNENGILLAEQTRDGLKKAGITFDKIFSSPYVRAQKTAEIIADGACKVETDFRIREMGFGKYEGVPLREVSQNPAYRNISYFFDDPDRYVAEDGCESYEQVFARVREFYGEKIVPLADTDCHCLVVCHGAVIRVFLASLCHTGLKGLWDIKQPNCCINIFAITKNNAALLEQAKLFY